MLVDLTHNKIIADTMSDSFAKSFNKNLIPLLARESSRDIGCVQMYEDHISERFISDGKCFYPLTVVYAEGEPVTRWISWKLAKGAFDEKSPYRYLGDDLEFELEDNPPSEFVSKLGGARYFSGSSVKVRVETTACDITFLSGKYSQSFVDEMARQLTVLIEDAMSVKGIADFPIELCLVFAPESYMEHTSENVTYRRLLLTDNSGAPRDFWIRWTRLDGATAFSVASDVDSSKILFELGEDVIQKVREKEYRFLLNAKGKDKYHNAMGRKNITEWREIIKRAIRRGELERIELETGICKETEDLTRELASVLGKAAINTPSEEVVASAESDRELEKALEFARETLKLAGVAVENESEESEEDELDCNEEEISVECEADEEDTVELEPEEEESDEDELEEFYKEDTEPVQPIAFSEEEESELDELARMAREAVAEARAAELVETCEEISDTETTDLSPERLIVPEEPCGEEYCDTEVSEIEDEESLEEEEIVETLSELRLLEPDEEEQKEETKAQPAASASVDISLLEDKIRKELEAKLRLEYEKDARRRAEEEAERLRIENERLLKVAKQVEEEKARGERERLAETEKLRAQIEAQLRAEARERERLADAARAAALEQRRLEEEKYRIERMRLEEERRLEAERAAKALEEERRLEAERIRRETEERVRAEYAAQRSEPAHTEPVTESAPETVSSDPVVNPTYTYTSKNVRLQFRRSVDPNITARIHEIIKATLDYYGKEKVYLKIKATVPDNQTVVLEFVRIPMEEMELLGNIIKVLGNSGLGIAKAIVE